MKTLQNYLPSCVFFETKKEYQYVFNYIMDEGFAIVLLPAGDFQFPCLLKFSYSIPRATCIITQSAEGQEKNYEWYAKHFLEA